MEMARECQDSLKDVSSNPLPAQQTAPSTKRKKQKGKNAKGSGLSSQAPSQFNSTDSSAEPGVSSSTHAETGVSQILSMQEVLSQLVSMQNEMQKQMAMMARLQDENAKQEKAATERMQQLTNTFNNCLNKDLPAIIEKTVKREVTTIGQSVARTITPAIEKTISASIAESFQKGVGDKAVNQLEISVSSKLEAVVARQIQAQFQTSGKQALQETLKSSLEASVVPAFEISCRTMFEQADAAFQKGMVEHTSAAQQQFEASHSPLALALRDALNSASSVTQTMSNELLEGQRKLLAIAVSGANSKAPNLLMSQLSNGPLGALHEKVEVPPDPTKELSRLIAERKYEDALTAALQMSDANIVSWLCSQVDLPGILSSNPLPLSQGVLLSLLQQLACDISKETPRKLTWMREVLSAINPSDPMIVVHVRPIFEQVYQILNHLRNLPTVGGAELSSIRLIMHVINSMLMSSKCSSSSSSSHGQEWPEQNYSIDIKKKKIESFLPVSIFREEPMNPSSSEIWIKHYSSSHNILLVGEGDFSFSLCLGSTFGCATNIVATTLDSYDELINKYKNAKANLEILRNIGASVLHGVDATNMWSNPDLRCKKFHRIIFNFPHAGFYGKESDPYIVMRHRDLVRGFLQNASAMLNAVGEIHVNHKVNAPFGSWGIEDLGYECALVCIAQDEFRIEDYPGYNNKRGSGSKADEPFRLGPCKTFRFAVNDLIVGSSSSSSSRGQEWPEQNYSIDINDIDHDAVVYESIVGRCREIVEEIVPANFPSPDESVELNSTEGEREEKEVKVKRRIKHYSSRHKILLVGEGDFSFSACLATAFGSSATNIIATCLNTKEFLKKNYGSAMSNIAELRSRGSKVMYEIDATEIANHESLGQLKFDRIIFNFPFAGFYRNLSEECQLRCHRRLVSLFLKNAKEMLSENGEIHVSHKTNGIHAKFMPESIASSHGLRLIAAVKFKCSNYPGYNTKFGFGGDKNLNCYPSKTFKFGLKTAPL